MRLEQDQQTIELAATSGFEGGANLDRVMAVVVDNDDVVDHTLDIEAASNARKFREAFLDQVRSNV